MSWLGGHWPYQDLAGYAVDLEVPKRWRRNAQRLFRWRERELCLTFPRENAVYSYPQPGAGADRYMRSVLRMKRESRRSVHTPWIALLAEWTPDRRCRYAMAENEAGEAVHHDDPTAARWCLAGWLAHRCMRPMPGRPLDRLHRPMTAAEAAASSWETLSDDRTAKRLLDEIWALLPERRRAIGERYRRRLTTAAQRRELAHHPLGYWWQLAPHLACRVLRIPG